ncbi:hypothetical protein Micbo1qcDRAFT_165664, partial [Microdochium bolleyi]
MPATATTSLLSGLVFGSGLALSGVASPQVIQDQFRLRNFHMLGTFLTASAASAAIFAVYNRSTAAVAAHSKISPRPAKSLGWLGRYDANVIGGAMVGV